MCVICSNFSCAWTEWSVTVIENAKWITAARLSGDAAPCFSRAFDCEKAIENATLYITSLGVYEAYLNGNRVGSFVLAPGWTSYADRLQYQIYDVTELLS